MTAVLVEVADAITAELVAAEADGTFEGLEFEPVRSYADWEYPLEDLDCLHVDVVPVNYPETDLDSRGSVGYTCEVDILVRKKFGQQDREQDMKLRLAEVDRLVLFVQELHEFFIDRRLTSYDAAVWQKTDITSAWSRTHLQKHSMFLGLIRVTYSIGYDL